MKAEQYRFELGSLYEFDAASNSYIHVWKCAGNSTKEKAIAAYEESLLSEDDCAYQ